MLKLKKKQIILDQTKACLNLQEHAKMLDAKTCKNVQKRAKTYKNVLKLYATHNVRPKHAQTCLNMLKPTRTCQNVLYKNLAKTFKNLLLRLMQ